MTKNICISIKNFATYQRAKAVAALRGEKISRLVENMFEQYIAKNTVNVNSVNKTE